MNDNDYQPLDLDEEDYGTCDTCIYADVTADLEPCASCEFIGYCRRTRESEGDI